MFTLRASGRATAGRRVPAFALFIGARQPALADAPPVESVGLRAALVLVLGLFVPRVLRATRPPGRTPTERR